MAKKPTILTLSGALANLISQINTNFTAVRDAFDNTLSLDGSTPNAMLSDLDMNNNDILNANNVDTEILTLNGVSYTSVPSSGSLVSINDRFAWKTPYDYGATVGEELSVDNSIYLNALMDAAKASWDSTRETYTIKVDLGGLAWRADTGTRLIDAQQPGMIIKNGTIYTQGAGNICLDLSGSNNVACYNLTFVGNRSNPPDIGILYGRNNSGAVAPNIKLYNCQARGKFNKFGRLNIASEVSTEVGCQWMNWSRSLTAYCDGCVDHMQVLQDRVGGVTSPNTTLRTVSDPAMSNTTHHWFNTVSLRQADFSLTVTGVTKANPAEVTFATGTLSSAGLSNGDTIVFTKVPVGSMHELTTLGPFTVANIDEANDTLELSGVNSGAWVGSFVQATCQNQTGPTSLYAGTIGLRRLMHYSLCYGNAHHVVDMATGQPIFDWEVEGLHERDPTSILKIYKGTINRILSGVRLRCLNYNQTITDAVVDDSSGTAILNWDNGYIHIPNMEAAPANGIFKSPSTTVIRENFHEIVPLEAALNTVSSFSAYFGKRYKGNAVRRYEDHSSADYYGDPRFVAEIDNFRGVHAYRDSDTASPGPFVDTIRKSASPTVNDSIGGFRMLGNNDAGEDVWYAGTGAILLSTGDGTENGRLAFQAMVNGTITTVGFAQGAGLYSRGFLVQTQQSATEAELLDKDSAVNQEYKFEGKQVWDSTNKRPLWADGTNGVDPWADSAGTTVFTPS